MYPDSAEKTAFTTSQGIYEFQVMLFRLTNAPLVIRDEVEYLGHIITPQGLKTNPRITSAVINFPHPRNQTELQRFLGMSSYYRRFVPNFSKIASPIQSLTRKDAQFIWTIE